MDQVTKDILKIFTDGSDDFEVVNVIHTDVKNKGPAEIDIAPKGVRDIDGVDKFIVRENIIGYKETFYKRKEKKPTTPGILILEIIKNSDIPLTATDVKCQLTDRGVEFKKVIIVLALRMLEEAGLISSEHIQVLPASKPIKQYFYCED